MLASRISLARKLGWVGIGLFNSQSILKMHHLDIHKCLSESRVNLWEELTQEGVSAGFSLQK